MEATVRCGRTSGRCVLHQHQLGRHGEGSALALFLVSRIATGAASAWA
jgi:hypothetical protein